MFGCIKRKTQTHSNYIDFDNHCKNICRILDEITNFCKECNSRGCCPEEECVLFRIEKIIEKEYLDKFTNLLEEDEDD